MRVYGLGLPYTLNSKPMTPATSLNRVLSTADSVHSEAWEVQWQVAVALARLDAKAAAEAAAEEAQPAKRRGTRTAAAAAGPAPPRGA